MILKQAWATLRFQTSLSNRIGSYLKTETKAWLCRGSPTHQHEVDIEGEDLATHVHTEGLWEVFTQVGKRACCTLEVGAGDFHALGGKR